MDDSLQIHRINSFKNGGFMYRSGNLETYFCFCYPFFVCSLGTRSPKYQKYNGNSNFVKNISLNSRIFCFNLTCCRALKIGRKIWLCHINRPLIKSTILTQKSWHSGKFTHSCIDHLGKIAYFALWTKVHFYKKFAKVHFF